MALAGAPVWLVLAAAVVVAGSAAARRAQPLSVLLLAAPLVAMAVLLRTLTPAGSAALIAGGLLVGGLLPWWQGRALARRYGGRQRASSVALRGWCCAGIVLAAPAAWLLSRALLPPSGLGWPLGVLGGLVVALPALLVLPLVASVYVQQITAADAPQVVSHAVTRELWLRGEDGVRLHARLYLPRDLAAARGLIVFTHGFGGWKEGFRNHLTLGTRAGWAVLAYDLRGHGRSAPAGTTFGVREQEDLIAVWAQAQRLAASRPLVAYGVSLGALVTLLAADRLPGCAGVVLESPFLDLAQLLRTRLAAPLAWSGQRLSRLAGIPLERLTPAAAAVLGAGPPLLIGWIADDATIPAAASAAVAARAPRARTLVMPHGEHLDTITYLPWRQAVLALLAGLASASGYDGRID